jgi:23S rRNA (guanine745-N1)-methyltransferase
MQHKLICPVCSQALLPSAKGNSIECAHGHLFDVARQGYLNLLLSQHKKSKQPGDTLEMVQARTAFLDSGFYQGIADFLIKHCIIEDLLPPCIQNKSHTGQSEPFHYCDLACGEGFYTQQIHQTLAQCFPDNLLYSSGIDISSPAIKAACRRDKQIQWLIASLARIPLADQSQDLVTGLFFHFDLKEIQRILKPGGSFIQVTTGPKHLIELRELIYDQIKPEKYTHFDYPGMSLEHRKTLYYTEEKVLRQTDAIMALLSMTPHYWRCKPEKKQQLATLQALDLTLDIRIDIFQI